MGEDAVLLFIARTVAEVPVIKRQATIMAEHDFRRVLDAEHVGEGFTTSCARNLQRTGHVFHNESAIVHQTIRRNGLRRALAAKVDDAGVLLHHRAGKLLEAFPNSGVFSDAIKYSLDTYKGTKNLANGQYIIC